MNEFTNQGRFVTIPFTKSGNNLYKKNAIRIKKD